MLPNLDITIWKIKNILCCITKYNYINYTYGNNILFIFFVFHSLLIKKIDIKKK